MRSFEHLELVPEGEDFELLRDRSRAQSRSVIRSEMKTAIAGRLLIAGCNSNFSKGARFWLWHASDADTFVLSSVWRTIVRLLRGCSGASVGLRSRCSRLPSVCPSGSSLRQGRLNTAVRSQFGFKMESVWNQRFTAGANSPIEPANRLWFSDFWKIRNMVAQIFPRWNRVADWLKEAERFSMAA